MAANVSRASGTRAAKSNGFARRRKAIALSDKSCSGTGVAVSMAHHQFNLTR